MANFNYLDFIKIPTATDRILSIKDKNNIIIYKLNPFSIDNVLVQNNNIRLNFTNSDYVLIDFNNNAESRIAISTLETYLQVLRNKVPYNIDKQTELYVNQLVGSISTIYSNLIPNTSSVISLGSTQSLWKNLYLSSFGVYIGGFTISSYNNSLVLNSINLGNTSSNSILSSNGSCLLYNNNIIYTNIINSATTSSTIIYDISKGNNWYHDDLSTNYTASFINVSTASDSKIESYITISQSNNSSYLPISLTINGDSKNIKWKNATYSTFTYSTDIVKFTFIIKNGNFLDVLGNIYNYYA